ncbi:MAG TPA: hypothetical protein VE955_09485 [Candidatus Dormibacteraeota bacterium]|jgi:hypothetical protein|nr:hypothetical protein [Candidatus Dormibacteraeota bacterium]
MNAAKKKFGRLYVVILVLVFVVATMVSSLAYYVASTPVDHMAIVSPDAALNSIRYYHNATYSFSSGNTRWLLITQYDLLGIQSNYIATLYIFKVAGNDGRDFRILGIDLKYNGTAVGDSWIFGTYYYSNSTVMTIGTHFSAPGAYLVDFGLKLQIYSSLLFLPIQQEQIRVATDLLAHYGS